jgi:Uma2 family endonuclease
MVTSAPHHVFTYAEYLERERSTGLKHEFLEGQVFAMSGGTPEHARLIAAVTMALGRIVDPGRCRVFTSELKVRVLATGLYTYPDVAVVCGEVERDAQDPNAITNPTVLVEVLSPSTEAYDRGEKWAHYRRVQSLRAYILVAQLPARLEVFERSAEGDFVHRVSDGSEHLDLACLAGSIEVDALYAGAL